MKTNTTAVYDRFDKVTGNISAWAIVRPFTDGTPEFVGKIVIRGRPTASGRTHRAFLQVFGFRMQEGVANGGGYDMHAVALGAAARKLGKLIESDEDQTAEGEDERSLNSARLVVDALKGDDGWENRIAKAGFTLCRIS